MFQEGVTQRRWSRGASSSSRSSQNTAGTDASMSELASSDADFSQSTDGTGIAITDIKENVPSASQGMMDEREQRALADLSVAAHVSFLGSSMTGLARPVCALLVRAGSAKSSLSCTPRSLTLTHAAASGLAATTPTRSAADSAARPPRQRGRVLTCSASLQACIPGWALSAWLAKLASTRGPSHRETSLRVCCRHKHWTVFFT